MLINREPQVINGILLPFILIFMLLLINDKRIMGAYMNSCLVNIVSWLTIIILIGLSVAMVISAFL
ncbi:MAG: divalent metal cation transporter [Smithella sp.]|jgi:Mn2+/Fe2+ NRAMP family transporter